MAASWAGAADHARPRPERRILFAVGCLAIAAAVAERVSLGEHVAQFGRSLASDEGWYQGRRPVQAAVILLIGGFSLFAAAAAVWLTRFQALSVRGLVLLLVVLAGFIAVRTISLHQVDGYLYSKVSGSLTLGSAVEVLLVGIIVSWLLLVPGGRRPTEQ